ncbi:Uncharacterized protein PRO82_001725 [Candidatus Protochlamydia amoebophila]|uniref:hypothetical protein n=1 Tax=Candidatus Protochlamydia amoebophila TaxID=362787 RepID=UPI001BC96EDD|nr:hypothetical protein [Candidatus Protochlamydia amoebophila]MBS4164397.1 Uncharacterized protein [Candidatus Protochlamydia amoebophila]
MIIDLCVNFISSTIELCKDVQIDESGLPSAPPSAIDIAAQKFFNKVGSPPSSFSKMKFLTDMSMQLPIYLSFGLYKFYFYQCKDIAVSKDFDNDLAIQLDKTKQIADKAIKEYQECIKLVENGIGREIFNFLPNWILNSAYGTEFVSLKTIIETDSILSPKEYANYFLNQLPKTKLKNFRLVSEKERNIGLTYDSWTIINSEQKGEITIPAEIFAKVHHRAMKDIPDLFRQYADTSFYQNLVDNHFKTWEILKIHRKRVEAYEQHQSL